MSLQQELKKRKPFDSPRQEALINLWRASDRSQNRFGRLFREHGLTASQYNVLRILRGEGKPLPCLDIADRMIQVVPAITRQIDSLEESGMIRRQRCTEDRRVVYIEITARGLAALRKLDEPVAELHEQMLTRLTVAEVRELNRLLEKAQIANE